MVDKCRLCSAGAALAAGPSRFRHRARSVRRPPKIGHNQIITTGHSVGISGHDEDPAPSWYYQVLALAKLGNAASRSAAVRRLVVKMARPDSTEKGVPLIIGQQTEPAYPHKSRTLLRTKHQVL